MSAGVLVFGPKAKVVFSRTSFCYKVFWSTESWLPLPVEAKHNKFTQPFYDYCRDIPLQKRVFTEAMKFPQFRKCVRELESTARSNNNKKHNPNSIAEIETFLIMPMNHLVRYHLLMDNVWKKAHLSEGDADVDAIRAADHLAVKFKEKANSEQAMTERAETLLKLFKRLVRGVFSCVHFFKSF